MKLFQVKYWYGWMGHAVSFLFGESLEITLGSKFQTPHFLNEAGWAQIEFGFISIQWDTLELIYF